MRNIRFLLTCFLAASTIYAQVPSAAPATANQQKISCGVDNSVPSEGDIALSKKDYDAGLTFFRAQADKNPASEEAHFGLVRALIGKNRTDEAQKTAQEMLKKNPQSALAETAAGEAAYRAADFEGARTHALAALRDNSCEARARALVAKLFEISAQFASEASYLAVAHKLRPNDELIRRDWIDSLPRKEEVIELEKYLAGPNALSERDRTDAVNEEDHLKAWRPGECRITSGVDTAKIPFVPFIGNGDLSHPQAYGLDVNLNGKRRRMQIDTGASGILLSAGAAKGLGLTPEYHLQTGGIGDDGEVESYLTHVASIQIGDIRFSDCMVEVLPKLKRTNVEIDSLIGVDVFDRWLVTLDYQNTELLLNPLPSRPGPKEPAGLNTATAQTQKADDDDPVPEDAITPPGMKDWLHVVRVGHNLLLPASLNKGKIRYMIADTGAAETTLSLAFARENGKPKLDDNVKFYGISGKVQETYRIDDAYLKFGRFSLFPQSFWAFDVTNVSHDNGVEVSGFVGLPTLSRLTITIDYRDNLMNLKYDPNNDHQRF